MNLQLTVQKVLAQLGFAINQLSDEEFVKPCKTLSNATIGQHIRHIIELFQCLESGCTSGVVNYESRQRNTLIETNGAYALQQIESISKNIQSKNQNLVLKAAYATEESFLISTNYFRELAYNLEHAIHHMALIRIGIESATTIQLPEEFGVAPSTIKYRQECAQ